MYPGPQVMLPPQHGEELGPPELGAGAQGLYWSEQSKGISNPGHIIVKSVVEGLSGQEAGRWVNGQFPIDKDANSSNLYSIKPI